MAELYTNLKFDACLMALLRRPFIFLAVLSLAACSVNDTKDENSTFYAIPVGSVLKLNQDVTINANQVAIYIQDGRIMPYREVEKYYPNCKFEIYAISEQPRTVKADDFKIVKVQDEIESSSLKEKTQLASRGGVFMFGMLDRSNVFNYATMMYLESDRQKDVYRMTCQHWEDVRDDRHLSITQMRKAMGDVFTLVINGD
ncbi:MAG: hypothetical protein KJN89_06605 [Gammaproteobacteria bacterium]|nr:hypothetical protein [Gammaproteobacteria bacterium]MBT8133455.1 hypothetical protein [Gammaproteobacteria bacterium]NNJ50028.1 hypothetical protein [Gammaproteobacteria bacterium]